MNYTHILEFIQHYILTLSALARFSIALAMLFAIPRLCRRVHAPAAVGLLVGGIIVGPYVLGIFGQDRPIADFLGELGKLLLMFLLAWRSTWTYFVALATARSASASPRRRFRCC